MGFWERMNANPVKNMESLKRSSADLARMRKQQSKSRRALKDSEKKLHKLKNEIAELRAELDTQQAAQDDALDRLTRCLFDNNVIEPADLAAMLPTSSIQDD